MPAATVREIPVPGDMAVAFNAADSSIGSRQLMSELDYLYKYDPKRHAYVGRSPGAEEGSVLDESRPFLIILQSENDKATGQFFPIGTGLFNIVNFRAHWDKVPVPGSNGQKVSESQFYDHTPGNNKYLVNYHVVPLGEASLPPGLKANENRAFEANIKENHPDYSFYTSCPAGSCAFRRRLFGVTADCGATTPSPCWVLFFAFIFR
jgi:hypothetical protein